jgi:hypothetical protein
MQRYQNAMDELQKLADKQVKAGAERKSAEEILAVTKSMLLISKY